MVYDISKMQAVILAGGLGTRISEETHLKPKPMIELGGKPIIWHIMKIYSSFGVNKFVICLGYKGYLIKEYFKNYFLHTCDVTIDVSNNKLKVHRKETEPWEITLIDTGQKTMTGGRLSRVKKHISEDVFCFTYGDGVGNINIKSLLEHHQKSKCLATLTAVKPPGRYGALEINENKVKLFREKPKGDNLWVNGGFFVLNKEVINYVTGDDCVWEQEPMRILASNKQLNAYKHEGFWQPMDTLRDKKILEEYWLNGNAPWKSW
tara:strand:- start:148 stop:936 length:789 start_codon:yes stop_codon:yes gene_type:complete